MNKTYILAYIQVSNNVIRNIAIHNSLISIDELMHILKIDRRFKQIYLDLSIGFQTKIKCKKIKHISPKSRLIESKRRTKYSNKGNIIWDCGYGIFELK
jgi:hypothetical protein